MKVRFPILVLLFLPLASLANDAERLIKEKEDMAAEFAAMSCANFKKDLPKLSENVDVLKFVKQDSVDFELATATLKKVIEKSVSCIK